MSRSGIVEGALGGHSASHHELLWLVALAAFAVAVLALALLYRRSSRSVELEEVDTILREHDRC